MKWTWRNDAKCQMAMRLAFAEAVWDTCDVMGRLSAPLMHRVTCPLMPRKIKGFEIRNDKWLTGSTPMGSRGRSYVDHLRWQS